VLGPSGHTWFTITSSTFTTGPISGNPLRMIRNRSAYLGHGYRTSVVAKLVVPNGHAGCSLTNTCSQGRAHLFAEPDSGRELSPLDRVDDQPPRQPVEHPRELERFGNGDGVCRGGPAEWLE
jgi:hypothetical protein